MRNTTSRFETPTVRQELIDLYESYLPLLEPTIEQMRMYASRGMVESYEAISARVVTLCTPVILNCSDYPDMIHDGRLERRTIGIISSYLLEIDLVPWGERLNVAFDCTYDILRNYISGGRDLPFPEDVEQDLPITYVRRLSSIVDPRLEIFCNKEIDSSEVPLPGSGSEYFKTVLKGKVTEIQREHFPFISRQNIYKLIPD